MIDSCATVGLTDHDDHPLSSGYAAQVQLEEDCVDRGVMEYRRRVGRHREKGMESLGRAGKHLLVRSIKPLSDAIQQFIADAKTKAGRKHTALRYVELVESDTLAFITMRVLYNGMTHTRRTVQSIGLEIAGRVLDEVRFRQFDDKSLPVTMPDGHTITGKRLFEAVERNLKVHPKGYQAQVRRSMMTHAMRKFDLVVQEWPADEKLHLGVLLCEIACRTTGFFTISRFKYARRSLLYISPTPELIKFAADFHAQDEVFFPLHHPMIAPPRPWTTIDDGGYYTERLQGKIVKSRSRGYLRELTLRDMPVVYGAVNTLQSSPWKINRAMLGLVHEIQGAGMQLKGFPSHSEIPQIHRPENYASLSVDQRREWKMIAANAYRSEEKRKSKVLQVAKVITLAEQFELYPAIWFPYSMDFRGRLYATPPLLNPQGSDLAKSLITFAEAKPLGDRGVWWLAVHVANMFGYDKVSLQERYEWTLKNSTRIESMSNDPLSDLWWTEADKPFQFLASCVEWLGYLTDGAAYLCSLPILVDGSNNGCQHFSAMSRDAVCGRLVNLTPQDKPADIYSEVATATATALHAYLDAGKDATEPKELERLRLAQLWIDYGITRKLTKRPVMVLPYGGTNRAVRSYITAFVQEEGAHPFGAELNNASTLLAGIMWDVMGEVIVGPQTVMKWLRGASRKVTKYLTDERLPIVWETPSGLLVQQRYMDTSPRRIRTKIGDQIHRVTIKLETDELDTRKQQQAISPNFVHSLDASALALTLVAASARGITQFAAIHDAYGTVAGEMDMLLTTLRECFVKMYEDNDVLEQFRERVSRAMPADDPIDPTPPRGDLDLAGVLHSEFFFS